MDDNTTIGDLKRTVKKFCDERDWDQYHTPKEMAIALSVEAGELLGHFQWKSDSEVDAMMSSPLRKEIEDELWDCIYTIIRLSQRCDIDLSTAMERKMAENAKNYPADKAKGKHTKYTEY